MTSSNIAPPNVRSAVEPVLSALPGAAVSTEPPEVVLPLLSPILRQRVQLLSSASTEPWIRLLSYDATNVPKLTSIAQSSSLEPHPVSGEIELDWECDVDVRYRRLDQETLQALVVLRDLSLFFRLNYCVGDPDGGDGWRVGEVGVASDPSVLADFAGIASISDAERSYQTIRLAGNGQSIANGTHGANGTSGVRNTHLVVEEEEDDDDDYWARYDATPARTPAMKRSPAPRTNGQTRQVDVNPSQSAEEEDAYYAQYDSVQPAMDNHDPDEEVGTMVEHVERVQAAPPLGLARAQHFNDSAEASELSETGGAWTLAEPPGSSPAHSGRSREDEEREQILLHPRPDSSASSNGSQTVARLEAVAKLEERAEKRDQGDFGVRQHVSRSIRSLFLLSRSSGIDREEFERMVQTELDVLGMVEDDI